MKRLEPILLLILFLLTVQCGIPRVDETTPIGSETPADTAISTETGSSPNTESPDEVANYKTEFYAYGGNAEGIEGSLKTRTHFQILPGFSCRNTTTGESIRYRLSLVKLPNEFSMGNELCSIPSISATETEVEAPLYNELWKGYGEMIFEAGPSDTPNFDEPTVAWCRDVNATSKIGTDIIVKRKTSGDHFATIVQGRTPIQRMGPIASSNVVYVKPFPVTVSSTPMKLYHAPSFRLSVSSYKDILGKYKATLSTQIDGTSLTLDMLCRIVQ